MQARCTGTAMCLALVTFCAAAGEGPAPDGLFCAQRSWLGQIDLEQSAEATRVVGDRLYFVGGGVFGIADVADPATPSILGTLELGGSSYEGLAIDGDLVYTVGNRFDVISTADPTSPVLLSSQPNTTPVFEASGVLGAWDGFVVVPQRLGFRVFDAADPAAPVEVSSVELSAPPFAGGSDGPVVALYTDTREITLFDLTDPGAPMANAVVEAAPEIVRTDKILIDGDTMVAVGVFGDFEIYRLGGSGGPEPLSLAEIESDYREGIALAGERLLIGGAAGVEAFDLSDPASPVPVGVLPAPDEVFGIAVGPDWVAMSLGVREESILIIDETALLDGPLLREGDRAESGVRRFGAGAAGAWAALPFAGVERIELAPDGRPESTAFFPTPGQAKHALESDGVLYVADGSGGLTLLDASTGVLVGNADTDDARAVALTGSAATRRAFVADGVGGVRAFDISDPGAPAPAGVAAIDGAAADLAVVGQRLVVLDAFARLLVYDISNAGAPVPLAEMSLGGFGENDEPGFATRLAASGDTLLVAQRDRAESEGRVTVAGLGADGLPEIRAVLGFDEVVNDVGFFGLRLVVLDDSELHIAAPDAGGAYELEISFDIGQFDDALAVFDGAALIARSNVLGSIPLADCPPCPADLDGNGVLDLADIAAFVSLFQNGDVGADLDDSGVLDLSDIAAFVSSFTTGCG